MPWNTYTAPVTTESPSIPILQHHWMASPISLIITTKRPTATPLILFLQNAISSLHSATHVGAVNLAMLFLKAPNLNYLNFGHCLVISSVVQGGPLPVNQFVKTQLLWATSNKWMCQRRRIYKALDMSIGNDYTQVYNDNEACVQWSHTSTSKGIKHVNLRENYVRELRLNKRVNVTHIPGVINPADIFTKEMKDGAHFCRLRDCMMCSKASYLKYHSNVPSEVVTAEKMLPYYSIRSQTNPSPVSQTVMLQHCRQGGVGVLYSAFAWFVIPVTSESDHELKRRSCTRNRSL